MLFNKYNQRFVTCTSYICKNIFTKLYLINRKFSFNTMVTLDFSKKAREAIADLISASCIPETT